MIGLKIMKRGLSRCQLIGNRKTNNVWFLYHKVIPFLWYIRDKEHSFHTLDIIYFLTFNIITYYLIHSALTVPLKKARNAEKFKKLLLETWVNIIKSIIYYVVLQDWNRIPFNNVVKIKRNAIKRLQSEKFI